MAWFKFFNPIGNKTVNNFFKTADPFALMGFLASSLAIPYMLYAAHHIYQLNKQELPKGPAQKTP